MKSFIITWADDDQHGAAITAFENYLNSINLLIQNPFLVIEQLLDKSLTCLQLLALNTIYFPTYGINNYVKSTLYD